MVINAVDVRHMYKCVKMPDFGGMLPPLRVDFCKSSKKFGSSVSFRQIFFSSYVSGVFCRFGGCVAVDGVPTKKEGGLVVAPSFYII